MSRAPVVCLHGDGGKVGGGGGGVGDRDRKVHTGGEQPPPTTLLTDPHTTTVPNTVSCSELLDPFSLCSLLQHTHPMAVFSSRGRYTLRPLDWGWWARFGTEAFCLDSCHLGQTRLTKSMSKHIVRTACGH